MTNIYCSLDKIGPGKKYKLNLSSEKKVLEEDIEREFKSALYSRADDKFRAEAAEGPGPSAAAGTSSKSNGLQWSQCVTALGKAIELKIKLFN